jgi:ArsR family transcriptional regulator, virulence genes transcriptional regulator
MIESRPVQTVAPQPLLNATEMLARRAEDVAELLSAMANAKRLMALCAMMEQERSVTDLAEIVDMKAAALSQQLARMRAMRIVATRRDAQTVYYRLASPEISEILQTLHRLYCAPELLKT